MKQPSRVPLNMRVRKGLITDTSEFELQFPMTVNTPGSTRVRGNDPFRRFPNGELDFGYALRTLQSIYNIVQATGKDSLDGVQYMWYCMFIDPQESLADALAMSIASRISDAEKAVIKQDFVKWLEEKKKYGEQVAGD